MYPPCTGDSLSETIYSGSSNLTCEPSCRTGDGGEALGRQPPQNFPDSDGAEIPTLFPDGEKGGPTEMGEDGGWSFARGQKVHKHCQGGENLI